MIERIAPDADPAILLVDEAAAGPLWGILDCARRDDLYREVAALGPDACCLFMGVQQEVLEAAPHLVRLRPGGRLLDLWRRDGWGVDAGWGMLFRSQESMLALRRFFRSQMEAELPDGRQVLFRFWDPRVQ